VADGELEDLAYRLVAPLRPGDALGDAALMAITAELALQYEFTLGDARTCIEVMPRVGARAERVQTTHFALGHRGGTMPERDALALCVALAERIRSNEDVALASVRNGDDGRVREVRGGTALHDAGGHYGLSPYRGCAIGCRFCYAQSRLQPLRTLLGHAAAPWGSWVDARVDLPELLARELATRPCAPIKLCPVVADPYQAIERRLRITRRCVEAIAAADRAWPTLVLTRAYAILDDLALWSSLPRAWVGVSLPTIDDDVRRHFEPRAASVAERLEVLARFADAGVPSFAVVQPVFPGDPIALADALTRVTAGVVLGPLEGEEQAGPAFDGFAEARTAGWQADRVAQLREALRARGIPLWNGELPPGVTA
jgi:DNA repair photolyase